ncbi:hypothetical protein UFOVP621_68 [uncultured Caudovirales phage]|uniref:Uncharacterized protein n=1 Tax=uncultured Caudovirales phage TaxID=2100421 RepID=A0A6J5N3K6_9CAUD|nr:hypothetical protein UFOVP621_68 [uncultured Caudovirales phage]
MGLCAIVYLLLLCRPQGGAADCKSVAKARLVRFQGTALIPLSSTAEHRAVNSGVGGSNPSAGAKLKSYSPINVSLSSGALTKKC